MTRLIGLYSPRPGCGKSTIAKALEARGWVIVSFAEPLRQTTITFLTQCGIPSDQAEKLVRDPKLKELPLERVPGHPTPRHLMRTLGTEWGRDCVTQKLWTEIARNRVKTLSALVGNGQPVTPGDTAIRSKSGIVIDDMRFPNEYEMVAGEDGLLVYVERPQAPPLEGDHPSDGALEDYIFDETIVNDGDDMKRIESIADRLASRASGILGPRDPEGWSGPKGYRDGAAGLVEALFVRGGQQEWRELSITRTTAWEARA